MHKDKVAPTSASELSASELIAIIQNEAEQRQHSVLEAPLSRTENSFALTSNAKAYLNNAEFRAQARMKWPGKLDRFPFNLSCHLQNFILTGVRLLFRDQQEVNVNLINALHQSLKLQQQLLAEVEALQMNTRAQQAEILALKQSIKPLRSQESIQ